MDPAGAGEAKVYSDKGGTLRVGSGVGAAAGRGASSWRGAFCPNLDPLQTASRVQEGHEKTQAPLVRTDWKEAHTTTQVAPDGELLACSEHFGTRLACSLLVLHSVAAADSATTVGVPSSYNPMAVSRVPEL